jgi:hypothetical protein
LLVFRREDCEWTVQSFRISDIIERSDAHAYNPNNTIQCKEFATK